MTIVLAEPTDLFDLDVQVETEPLLIEDMACKTDDGCGNSCRFSACNSQL